jgi:hypothetical protein
MPTVYRVEVDQLQLHAALDVIRIALPTAAHAHLETSDQNDGYGFTLNTVGETREGYAIWDVRTAELQRV